MALEPCRECGKTVSTEAKTCPNCGVRDPVNPGQALAGEAIAFFGLIFCVAILIAYRCG